LVKAYFLWTRYIVCAATRFMMNRLYDDDEDDDDIDDADNEITCSTLAADLCTATT